MMRAMGTRARRYLAALLLLAPVLAGTPPAPARAKAPASALSSTERKLVQRIDRHQPESLALLERLVNINSGTSNLAGVREVGRLFAGELDALGFRTRWVDGTGFARAGHLIAERGEPTASLPKIVLVGHLDTVFEPDSPFQRFQRLDDSTATGPGVVDMKGGDVVMLLALRALHDTGELDRLRVSVVLNGDEESPGRPIEAARAALVEAARGATAALGFEDGDGDPRHVIVSRRGSTGWTLSVSGTPSHSSQVFTPDVGIGAIFETARILERFRDSLAFEPYLTFNPGLVLGGTSLTHEQAAARGTAFGKSNVVAETTLVTGDLRALTLEQREHARAVMERIVADGSTRTSASIVFDDSYPPLAPTDGNRKLLAMIDQASRDLGLGALTPVDPARAGAADVSFLAGQVPMVVDAMGLKGGGGHTVLETARLRTLAVQAKRVAVTLSRLARQERATAKR
jgi:glutamate carboxypeptidase